MLDAAQEGGYAYPAVNITSLTTASGALKAFSELKSDGIIQISTGGGQFASGLGISDAAFGSIVLAEAVHRLAEKYDVLVALHTDHCHPKAVDSFLKPLLEASRKRIAEGKGPLFQSHMFDGSVVDLAENMEISVELLKECAELDIILEVEAGCVGGEEDGHDTSGLPAEKLTYRLQIDSEHAFDGDFREHRLQRPTEVSPRHFQARRPVGFTFRRVQRLDENRQA